NYGDASRWRDLGPDSDTARHTALNSDGQPMNPDDVLIYESNVTQALRDDLNGKYYVIKPVEIDAPTMVYKNVGNVLLQQREKVLAWIASHANNPDAVARYQVQLDLIDQALSNLGLLQTDTGPGSQQTTFVRRDLDL